MTIRRPITLIDGLFRLLPSDERLPMPDVGARIRRSSVQSIPHNVPTDIIFDEARWDTNFHWNSAQPSRLYCKVAGKYLIGASVVFAYNTTGDRQISINAGTAGVIAQNYASAGVRGSTVSGVYTLAVNQFIRLTVFQNSGVALYVSSINSYTPELYFQLLS